MATKYKPTGNISLFDEYEIKTKLSELGNPLEKLLEVLDFEMFRNLLEEKLLNHENWDYFVAKYSGMVYNGSEILFSVRRYNGVQSDDIVSIFNL